MEIKPNYCNSNSFNSIIYFVETVHVFMFSDVERGNDLAWVKWHGINTGWYKQRRSLWGMKGIYIEKSIRPFLDTLDTLCRNNPSFKCSTHTHTVIVTEAFKNVCKSILGICLQILNPFSSHLGFRVGKRIESWMGSRQTTSPLYYQLPTFRLQAILLFCLLFLSWQMSASSLPSCTLYSLKVVEMIFLTNFNNL